ncbi:hypothetical protein JX265_004158 [Neoarthrinium moseri]|uniref:Uncharacterized protein n=1 Tax=Neoarthrinium moseri TaxID=1658444 RepID=A0A9P9WS71_9PEZI|nr:hypothetical protein JX265_004158 [Neoarthrinium moseri]
MPVSRRATEAAGSSLWVDATPFLRASPYTAMYRASETYSSTTSLNSIPGAPRAAAVRLVAPIVSVYPVALPAVYRQKMRCRTSKKTPPKTTKPRRTGTAGESQRSAKNGPVDSKSFREKG